MLKNIYKIVEEELWRTVEKDGCFKGAAIDLSDGYIHFSTAEQLWETAEKYFANKNNLLLVAVNAASLGEKLKWEPARGGALFPHLYDILPLASVLWTRRLPWLESSGRGFPELSE